MGDQHELDIRAEKVLPGFLVIWLCFELLEDRSPAVAGGCDRNCHQQERSQERDAPAPVVERFGAEYWRVPTITATTPRSRESRGLQPTGVVAAAFVRYVLGDVGDGASYSPPATGLDHSQAKRNAAAIPIDWKLGSPDHPVPSPFRWVMRTCTCGPPVANIKRNAQRRIKNPAVNSAIVLSRAATGGSCRKTSRQDRSQAPKI